MQNMNDGVLGYDSAAAEKSRDIRGNGSDHGGATLEDYRTLDEYGSLEALKRAGLKGVVFRLQNAM